MIPPLKFTTRQAEKHNQGEENVRDGAGDLPQMVDEAGRWYGTAEDHYEELHQMVAGVAVVLEKPPHY